jgi:hypothetical protein
MTGFCSTVVSTNVTRIHFALLHLHHQYKGDHFQSSRMMGIRVPTESVDGGNGTAAAANK